MKKQFKKYYAIFKHTCRNFSIVLTDQSAPKSKRCTIHLRVYVVLGIYNFACGSTHFANVRSEDRTDQLASVRISQNMAAELILRFSIVFAKFAFSSRLNSEVRPGTGLILTPHWSWMLLRRTGLEKKGQI